MEVKLLEIINHYGVLPQLKYLQSEVFELNEAIMILEHYEEFANDQDYQPTLKQQKEHIAEELADVMVMLCQFKEYYKIDGNEIMRIMNEKIDRQLKRIKNEKDCAKVVSEKNVIKKLNEKHFHKRQRQLANKINEILDMVKELERYK